MTASPTELWYTRCGSATASALAIQKGWLQHEFSGNGTVLHSLRDSPEQWVRDSHFNHKLSGMFREGGNIPPIWARAQNQPTAVVAITWLDEYQGILVRDDSSIREVAQLKHKRLAIPLHGNLIDFQRGAALHGFKTALGLYQLGLGDATLVDVRPPSRDAAAPRDENEPIADSSFEVRALLAGEVDAVFLRFPRGARIARDPRLREIININDLKDPLLRVNNGTPRPVTVDRPFLDKHPDLVARYLAVLLRTANWAAQHPQDVIDLLIPEGGGGAEPEDVLRSHGSEVHRSFTPTLSADYIRGLDTQKNFLWEHGFLESNFDINDWIVPGPLEAAKKLVAAQGEPAKAA